jgi:transcriptional regulator
MLRNIVGIEIAVTSLVGKSKLSQNKETRDRIGAADALDARGKGELARVMGRAGD